MIICKIADQGDCPEKRKICCAFCEKRDECTECCMEADSVLKSEKDPSEACDQAEEQADPKTLDMVLKPEEIANVQNLVISMSKLEDRIKEIRESLQKTMEQYGIKSFKNDRISITYVGDATRTTFDKAALLKDHPEIRESDYQKKSTVKAHVVIKAV